MGSGEALDLPGRPEFVAALDDFASAGDVLELACGPGDTVELAGRY